MSQYDSTPINQLPVGTVVQATDVYPAVDTLDHTESPAGTCKQYRVGSLQAYLVNSFDGSNVKTCYAATTGPLTANYVNGTLGVGATLSNAGSFSILTIDGITTTVGMRILVSFQTSSLQNGVYVVTAIGSSTTPWILTRASDFDNSQIQIAQGDFVGVLFGSLYAKSFWWVESTSPIVIGTDPIVFGISSAPTGEQIVNQTSATATIVPGTVYISSAGASLITYTLPAVSAVGDFVELVGNDSGLYTVAQLAGQSIVADAFSTTVGTGGSISSTLSHQNIKLRCIVANTIWTTVSIVGNFNYV